MNFSRIAYKHTGYFSGLIVDYIDQKDSITPFISYEPSYRGLEQAIQNRSHFPIDRKLLVDHLKNQYNGFDLSTKTSNHIHELLNENTFTICTAHQPALFTGSLYLVYKVIHTIKLAASLNEKHPEKKFVPVFWMGSEDADLDELGKCYLNGEKLVWKTPQSGAVGKMNTKGIEQLIQRVSGELSVEPFGEELIQILQSAYLNVPDFQTATFKLLYELFDRFGLVILIPDTPILKKQMSAIFEDDLLNHHAKNVVEQTNERLSQHYKTQAYPREINLFYFKDNIRERIEQVGEDQWKVVNNNIVFNKSSLLKELHDFPERFSPNVILRGLYQETILPNIAYIGGGGETAYWLQLKDVFDFYKVPFPVLILRNSFLWISTKENQWMNEIEIKNDDLFKKQQEVLNKSIQKKSPELFDFSNQLQSLESLKAAFKEKTNQVDSTLSVHTEAIFSQFSKRIQILEEKMLKAERKKEVTLQHKISLLFNKLFPHNGLQERVDNFMPYYAKMGPAFIDDIYEASPLLDHEFTIIKK